MDIKVSKFHHIEQFRNVVRNVQQVARYVSNDNDGNPIFDNNKPLPILTFIGTCKLHGSNGSFVRLNDGTTWVQSRENIITPEQDNYGFATFCHKNETHLHVILDQLEYDKELYSGAVVYGEWVGKGIQKNVGISQFDKMFVVFNIKLLAADDANNVWVSDDIVKQIVGRNDEARIYNVYLFDTFKIDIDFTYPELITNKLIELTEQVEKECPATKYFLQDNSIDDPIMLGEGIVWHCNTPPYTGGSFTFKVKGSIHSASKVKKLASVDVEKVNSIKECVEKIITENRMNQGLEHLKQNNLEIIPQNIGTFIKWVVTDAIREELDTIIESGLDPKDIGGVASKVARNWFFQTTQINV